MSLSTAMQYMTSKFCTTHPTDRQSSQQAKLALEVLAGIQQLIKDLKSMFKGRYPGAIRQDLHAVFAVAASKCTDVKGLVELLNFVEGNSHAPPMCLHGVCAKQRSDTTPAAWVAHGENRYI
jgi:hypothetical protein